MRILKCRIVCKSHTSQVVSENYMQEKIEVICTKSQADTF